MSSRKITWFTLPAIALATYGFYRYGDLGSAPAPSTPLTSQPAREAVSDDPMPAVGRVQPGEPVQHQSLVFSTPLVPTGLQPVAPADKEAVDRLAADYTQLGGQGDIAAARRIGRFLDDHPASPFAVSLLLEQSEIEWRHGYFSDALATLKKAWGAGKAYSTPEEKRLAEQALAGLIAKTGQLGRREELRELVREFTGKSLGGFAKEAWVTAKERLWFLENRAEDNIFCGFSASNELRVPSGQKPIFPDVHDDHERKEFVTNGLSLFELKAHNEEAGVEMKVVKRGASSAKLPVPSIIHWKFNHYSAVTEEADGLYRIKDRHLDFDGWVTAEAIFTEFSGYAVVPAGAGLPNGYSDVSENESKTVFGRHCVHDDDPEGGQGFVAGGGGCVSQPTASASSTSNGGTPPMAGYQLGFLNPGLEIFDTPIAYNPPYGPSVAIRLEYDQRSTKITDLAAHGNFGPRWTHNYAGYISNTGTGTPFSKVDAVFGNGEFYRYTYSTTTQKYSSITLDRPRLDYLNAVSGGPGYQLRFSDGQEWLYTQPNSATPTRFYLRVLKDSFGNSLTLRYAPGTLLLEALVDAVGRETLFSYAPEVGDAVPTDTTKIRSITDPFGRSAKFKYTSTGQLQKIIDPVNITSEFFYSSTESDFIEKLKTPYGETHFSWQTLEGINAPGLAIEATDPHGDKERVERNDYASYPASGRDPNPAPSSVPVAGQAVTFRPKNTYLYYRNTFYWDKLQMKLHPRDYSKATIVNWKANGSTITGVAGSILRPFESRVWFNYPNQSSADDLGDSRSPAKIVRLVEGNDGVPVWTMEQREYDPTYGKLKRSVDSLGREVTYEYNNSGTVPGAVAGLDLTAIKVKRGTGYDVVAKFADFVGHQPREITDAAGQMTRLVYNAVGQVTSVQNAKGEITTFSYYADDSEPKRRKGESERIDGPLPGTGDSVVFDYDSAGNVASILSVADGYSLSMAYDNIDRLTRVTFPDATFTENTYEVLDLKTARDRLGRTTNYTYNKLRQLTSVTAPDPTNRTVRYQWCKCGDLRQLIDEMGRATTWLHDAGGRVVAKKYVDGSQVSYAYQPHSGRLASITDEKGQIKAFSYFPDGSLARTSYPNALMATPEVAFTYDPAYPRPATMIDGIGTTSYAYHPITAAPSPGAGQLASVDGPWANDTITYSYDELGRAITRQIDGAVNSQTLAYDAAGRVGSIANALGTFTYAYEGDTSRLASVTHAQGFKTLFSYLGNDQDRRLSQIKNLKPDGITPLSIFDYTYDDQGRIAAWKQQVDADAAKTWTIGYDNSDQMKTVQVHQNGNLIEDQSWNYDPAGNRLSETLNGSTKTFNYNALNEVVQTSGLQAAATYEWDAENRLVAVNKGTNRSEFTYDGFGRSVRIVEKTNGSVTSNQSYLWTGLEIGERRDSGGSAVQQRYFSQGFSGVNGGPTGTYLYTRDHLGSIRELVSPGGTIAERIGYDACGQPTFSSTTPLTSFAFTGHFWHSQSALHLAPFRAYVANQGRWLSRDLAGEGGGINLYTYVLNDSVGLVDPLGLQGLPKSMLDIVLEKASKKALKNTTKTVLGNAGVDENVSVVLAGCFSTAVFTSGNAKATILIIPACIIGGLKAGAKEAAKQIMSPKPVCEPASDLLPEPTDVSASNIMNFLEVSKGLKELSGR